jgi:hypothetical protein
MYKEGRNRTSGGVEAGGSLKPKDSTIIGFIINCVEMRIY